MKKFILTEEQAPRAWYNIAADLSSPLEQMLNPTTRKPVTTDELEHIFSKEAVRQELTTERFIEIPDEVRRRYAIWRPSPLVRAYSLEKALDTPAHIYFKNESVSPVGSHKLNTAIPQAFYCAEQGIRRVTTETGGGQWGSALALASQMFGLDVRVYMVKVSCNQKPYRKSMMNAWGAEVVPSPSNLTEAGRRILAVDPECSGSLGIAISEAVEEVVRSGGAARYCLGSVMNHVLLHQTIIGQEAAAQMEMADEEPDVVIGCFGGGSNFAGIAFPFLRKNFTEGSHIRALAVEPAMCPKLTRGEYRYDYGDTAGMTPLVEMYTLGHNFQPADIHAGGLRYHGAGALVSRLRHEGLIEAEAIGQNESFAAGVLFARTEGIIPAPESAHAIAAAVREARAAREEGRRRTILFNLSGHGMVDMYAYERYFAGALHDDTLTDDQIAASIARI